MSRFESVLWSLIGTALAVLVSGFAALLWRAALS